MDMLNGLPWICYMGCHGYVTWVAVDMLHGLLWICYMGCGRYVAWVAVDMLCFLAKNKVNPQFLTGLGV